MLNIIYNPAILFCISAFLSCCTLRAADSITFTFEASSFATLEQISQSISEPFLCEALTYDVNSYIDSAELKYLLGFAEGDFISAQQLSQAINHLLIKHRFEELEVTISPCVIGKHLHLRLHSFWALEKIKIYGWLRGKEKYRALYLIEPGEKFDEIKHAHSIKKIKDALHAEGYLGAQVTAQFSHDQQRRTLCVDITIKKGKKVVIKNIDLKIASGHVVPNEQREADARLQRTLYKKFIKPLKKAVHTKALIQDQTRAIKEYLHELGYLAVDVRFHDVVQHEDNTIDLKVTVELGGKRAIFFLGNHFFSAQELRDLLLDFGRSAWLVPAEILSEEIQQAYHKKGFWQATIRAADEKDRYLFVIDEGERVKIEEITVRPESIEGQSFKKSIFAPVLTSDFYDEKLVQTALSQLLAQYHRLGYIDATIIDVSYQPRANTTAYVLVITLDEGPRWMLAATYISEHPELESHELFKARNVPFNAELLESQRSWLMNHFTAQGFTGVRVTPELDKDENANSITVRWKITKGPQALFGKTVIVGTSRLPFRFIERELQYAQGDVWNPAAVKKSFMRLKELEIFDSIQLHQAQSSAAQVEKTMVLKLLEDDPFEFRLRAGAELQYIQEYHTFGGLTYKLGGSFLAKNPFNRADLVRLDADFARSHFEVYATYRQPWFFSIPLRTMIQAYAIKHDQPGFVGNTNNLYRLTQYGGLINVGRKTDHLDSGVNFGFEWMETKLNEPTRLFAAELARALNFDIRLLDKQVPYFMIEPTLLVDYVDNNLYPHKGSLTLLSAKAMIPLKSHESNTFFIKLLLEQSVYMPVHVAVLALRLRVGHIFYQEFSAIMPSERFYLGGSQSIRSYNTDLAPPLGVFRDDKGKEMIVPRGGKTMINGNAEIRVPIFTRLEGVLFQDLGMLSSDNFATFKAKDILAGTGFGVRFKTPIGPLRFDFGFKWRRDVPSQPGWAWSLMFGNAY